MKELVENDRVVGGLTPEASIKVSKFYKTFVKGKVLKTDATTAELCKLTENSFRDVNIAFANELSLIAANSNIDVSNLIAIANHHPRVNILNPGIGVGGHCIAVDPWFIVANDPDNTLLIQTARKVNIAKTNWVTSQIITAADSVRKEREKGTIACLGLSYKPDVDDLRESPALMIAINLINKGYNIVAVEPNLQSHDQIKLVSLDEAIHCADLTVVLVKHSQFIEEKNNMKLKAVSALDFCGI